MKNKHTTQFLRSALSVAVAVALLVGTVPAVFAADTTAAVTQKEPLIQLLDDLNVNYQDYLNSDVAFRLPDGIAKDEEVSVIIRHDTPSVMDAYDKPDKTMSLQEFAASATAKLLMRTRSVKILFFMVILAVWVSG